MLNLNRNKASLSVVTIIIIVIVSLSVTVINYTHNSKDDLQVVMHTPSLIKTSLYAEIVNLRLEKSLSQDNYFSPNVITPAVIIRGNSFVATGRLEDPATGLGLPNEPIEIFWSTFSWAAYEVDRTGFKNDYLVGEDFTDSNGDFSVACRDTDYSKDFGVVTVYTVFPGDPYLGPIEDNRQYTSENVECYASIYMGMSTNTTLVREQEDFFAVAGLLYYDNDPLPVVPESNGEDIDFEWLGFSYTDTIVGLITNTTFTVPLGTPLAQHTLEGSFNVSLLGLSYVVGDIRNESLIGTSAADWSNETVLITVFSGAGITFSIDDPEALGPGANPVILRNETSVTISGLIEDSFGNPYVSDVNLEIYVDQGTTQTPTTLQATTIAAGGTGLFNSTFVVYGTYLPTGVNNIWLDVATGQGIVATTEYEIVTIVGNSTVLNSEVNNTDVFTETYMVMPGETIEVTGTLRDIYDNRVIEGMSITAQWDSTGPVYNSNTSATGTFTILMAVPLSFTAVVSQWAINIEAFATTYYDASNTSFTLDIFTTVNFAAMINSTNVTEDAGYNSIDGNPLYNNSTFTLQANLTDQFDRPIADRIVNITFASYGDTTRTLSSTGDFGYFVPGDENLLTSTDYTVTITFKENIDFSFRVNFQVYPTPTNTDTGVSSSPPPGGTDLGPILIGILIAMVSGIIIVSTVYAFGRFRKSKKRPGMAAGVDQHDLNTILKLIDESEKAKDYKRASVLCYRAFESICMTNFGITNALSLSPRELARIIASTNRVPVRDVTMIVMRFEEARFSDHKIAKNSYTQARQALHNIQLALEKNPTQVQR